MISLKGISAGYEEKAVLEGIDLSIGAGEFVGILGPNACGKSTLLKVVAGVLKPLSGTAEVAGLDPHCCDPGELARKVAVVPQTTRVPFAFTGEEVVAFGRYSHAGRFSPLTDLDRAKVAEALTLTDTLPLAHRPITELSGGERQRLIFARALAQDAELLLLDEATASMDIHRAIDAFDLLKKLHLGGRTVVAVLHDLNLAALYCDRLVLMRAGVIVADGPTEKVFTAENLCGVYETPLEVFVHPVTARPHAVFLPRS